MTTSNNTTDQGQKVNANLETITPEERKQLVSCEASIRNGLKAYQNVGKALTVIAQGRLYRSTHSTFAKYAKEKWDMTTARVSQLQHAYRVHQLLTAAGFKTLPVTESQCRPLARIPQDAEMDSRIISVWRAVVDSKEKITAKSINDAVDSELGIEPKQETAGGSSEAGTAGTAGKSDDETRAEKDCKLAEMRAELQAARQKIAYLESVLEAEKRAHQRTKAANGVPKSELATKLYKAGFRALAKEMHPDHGGSEAAMRELNQLKGVLLD